MFTSRFLLFSILVLILIFKDSHQLWCLDGSDCEKNDTCALCEGAACLRVQRPHKQKGLSVAMTCVPHDSLIHSYHPEGCRTELTSGEKLCLCSGRDFCNISTTSDINFWVVSLCFLSFFIFHI